ncbi:hypothetical protein PG985_016378 [Apiospora marii]|uniref:uncharacterized protein n=1 Tax=Apiospora marii TaxID=335849 RepID=UPI003131C1BD
MPSQPPGHEPVVKVSSPLLKGYVFVPKGNVYITANCRRLTQAAKRTVYAVINHRRQSIGIRVPAAIHAQVVQDERASRADRASAVEKRDAALEKQFREAILKQFPKTPAASVPLVVQRAMLKGSRRVGRTGKLDIETKARLAVRAHIRHTHTDYDGMLRAKTHTKNQARDVVLAKIDEVAKSWGGKVDEHRRGGRYSKKQRKQGRDDRKRGNGNDKGKAKSDTKSSAAATKPRGQNIEQGESSSGRRRSSLVRNRSPMQVKKLQVRLARRDSGGSSNPAKTPAQTGTSLRPYTIDSDSEEELEDDYESDESDGFEWCESDDDDVHSDSEWTPDD